MNKFFQKLKTKKGFTLIELIIAVAVFSLIMGAVASVFAVCMRDITETKTIDDTNDDLKIQIVLDKYKDATDPDGDGIKEINGYKVKVIDYDEMGDFKLTDDAGNIIVDLAPESGSKKYYEVTSPNGKINYYAYD